METEITTIDLIKTIAEDRSFDTQEMIKGLLEKAVRNRLAEVKEYMVTEQANPFDDSEDFEDSEVIEEGNPNIVRMGRYKTIRRQVRRDARGRMIVRRNARRSVTPGYRLSGTSLKRVSATERFRRSQNLKRAWRSTRRAKLNRTLLRRKMSILRRRSLGLR